MRRLSRSVRIFGAHQRGNIPIMTALLMPLLVLVSGGAVDLVVHERGRVALQDALDRGVLAAASLNQTEDPTSVVRSFLKNVPNGDTATLTVSETKTLNRREVKASASIDYSTTFLKLANVSSLSIGATSTAEESRNNVELSLVLDISGSMQDNGGMTQLRPAAKSFLDIVLKEESRPTTSVSVIPFAGQVNVGKDVFAYITSAAYNSRVEPYDKDKHAESWCIDFTTADFSAGTPPFYDRRQTPHFSYYNINALPKQPWWCPTAPTITYMTNDLTTLKTKIDALQPYDGTGTAYGMKWAELLLNPSMRSTLQAIRTKGYAPIPAAFSSRPADFPPPGAKSDTLKFIVLMTDGQIGFQPRPTAANPLPDTQFKVTTRNATLTTLANGKPIATETNGVDNTQSFKQAQAEAFYKSVCQYSNDEGITVFTIAFKVTATIAASIATCASNPSYAYKVDGLDMSAAFQSIAAQMQSLRITK